MKLMKKTLLWVGIVVAMSFAVLNWDSISSVLKNEEVVYSKPEPETVVKTETVEVLEVRIKNAQDEARERIESEAQALYDEYVEEEMTKVSDQVKEEYIAEIEATISSAAY